mmetsp:Transcript_31193/g.53357  ORF Transcript_31193/g.53357 Transcript_31193/m.53357 type:complete len:203 (+) Transcript_31193:665-1273(+)
MPGTLVAKWSSTSTCPRALFLMPTFSRPRPSVNGTRPVESSTMSASIFSCSPPATGSVTRVAPPAGLTVADTTLVESLNFIFCLRKIFSIELDTSSSIPGVIRSRNSTTVTCAPRRRHTEPISSPMTPAPMTTMLLGTSDRSRAPVDVTMVFSSTSTPLSDAGSEPVAMTMFLVDSIAGSDPPSMTFILTEPADRISPDPLK